MSAAIHVGSIVKTFGAVTAVDGVSFVVNSGEIFGLLGPDGAGKSTLIRLLVTLLPPTAGSASINGLDVVTRAREVRRSIGVVLQTMMNDPEPTVEEHLLTFAMLHGVPRARRPTLLAHLIDAVELTAHAHTPVRGLATALRRRLEIARALVHEPAVLVLDEPTAGLDRASRTAIWTILRKLKTARTLTVLLATDAADEAETLCDRIAVLDQGRLVALDTPARLKAAGIVRRT